MKLNGATIFSITHSPSNQIVAHVQMDAGVVFQMPFGPEATPEMIVAGVQREVSNRLGVKVRADELHAMLAEVSVQAKARVLAQQVASQPPAKRSIWTRFWRRLLALQ